MLSDRQRIEFKQQLKQRYYELREEIRQQLINSDEEHFIDLAGQVHDLEEESVADLLVDLNLAMLDQHIAEIRAIDASLIQIANDSYGICGDCTVVIDIERLKANLTSTRCTRCQTAYEHSHAGPEPHTL